MLYIFFISAHTTTEIITTGRQVNQWACRRQPDIITFARHFNNCIVLNKSIEYPSTKLQHHLSYSMKSSFFVTVIGVGLNCKPIGGMLLVAVSLNGNPKICTTLIGSEDNGMVKCQYRCHCPDVCSALEAYIDDESYVTVCEITIRIWTNEIDIRFYISADDSNLISEAFYSFTNANPNWQIPINCNAQ